MITLKSKYNRKIILFIGLFAFSINIMFMLMASRTGNKDFYWLMIPTIVLCLVILLMIRCPSCGLVTASDPIIIDGKPAMPQFLTVSCFPGKKCPRCKYEYI